MTVEGKITNRAKELITKIRCDFENDKTLVANWNRCYVDLVIQDDYLNPDYTHLQRSHGCQSALNKVAVPNHEQRNVCICKISECCSGGTCGTDHNLSVGYSRSWLNLNTHDLIGHKPVNLPLPNTNHVSRIGDEFFQINYGIVLNLWILEMEFYKKCG